MIDTILILDASCYGVNDGQIIVNVSGGSSPYIQNWGFNNPNQIDEQGFDNDLDEISFFEPPKEKWLTYGAVV